MKKSTGVVLGHYGHLEAIPTSADQWDVDVRGAARLSANLEANREAAFLFRDLATLRADAPLFDSVDELRWRGPTTGFAALCDDLGSPDLARRATALAEAL